MEPEPDELPGADDADEAAVLVFGKSRCKSCGNSGVDFLGNPCSCGAQASDQAISASDVESQGLILDALDSDPRSPKTQTSRQATCVVCGGLSTSYHPTNGTMMGSPCKVCCKVNLINGHKAVAGSSEMPIVLEFAGQEERIFVWRFKKAWCVKKRRPAPSPDQATAPPLLGGAKVPPDMTNPVFVQPEVQTWRNVSIFHADACLKQTVPRSRSYAPNLGKPKVPNFNEKTVEVGRKMLEPQAGWKPAGVKAIGSETGGELPSAPWGVPWGKKELKQSLSLPTLRRANADKIKKFGAVVTTKELADLAKEPPTSMFPKPPDKEFRFVAEAMNEPTGGPPEKPPPMSTYPDRPPPLELSMRKRRNFEWKHSRPELPKAISDLIGYGDILFEPPNDDDSTLASSSMVYASTMSYDDSRSALRDNSRSVMRDESIDFLNDASYASTQLPDIMPKAKSKIKSLQSPSTTWHLPKKETAAEAKRRESRELVQITWKLQHSISPVKVSPVALLG